MNPPGRSILVVAIIALLGLMGGIVYYASLDNDDLSMATIELQSVELTDVNSVESRATLQVTFLVANNGDVTVTVPVITYQLYADGSEVGSGTYSTEDVAMPGRAAFYPDAEIPLKNKLTIVMSDMLILKFRVGRERFELSITAVSRQYHNQTRPPARELKNLKEHY